MWEMPTSLRTRLGSCENSSLLPQPPSAFRGTVQKYFPAFRLLNQAIDKTRSFSALLFRSEKILVNHNYTNVVFQEQFQDLCAFLSGTGRIVVCHGLSRLEVASIFL